MIYLDFNEVSSDMLDQQISTLTANKEYPGNLFSSTQIQNVDAEFQPEWIWLVLVVMPISCIIGNTLVVAAVLSNKSLQTPTNYLLVSLACADLMVGTMVMPFHIYMTINSLHWHLPTLTCYVYCVLDVLASTSSIIHLLLISMDRLVAATKPAEYKTHKHKRRVYVAIAFCWIFSICLSLPLVFGSNDETEAILIQKHHCGIYNPTYMFGSSIFAFFLPLLFMSTIYGYIFYTLKRRLRAIQLQEMAGGQFLGFGADIGNIATSAIETVMGVGQKNRNMITWEKPLLKKIEETAAEHASSLNESEREQIQHILQAATSSGSTNQHGDTTTNSSPQRYNDEHHHPHHHHCSSTAPSFVPIENDEISQQPSMILDAITMPSPSHLGANNNSGGGGCSYLQPGDVQHEKEFESRFLTVNNFLGVPQIPKRRHSEQVEHKMSTNIAEKMDQIENVRSQRRHSYQHGVHKKRMSGGASLRPRDSKKRMRRLSELITGWERPSRSSLSQMLQFARRDSVYMARKKLAGLKDWALDLIAKLKSKQGLAIRREARATKLVATVMGVFLICWAPYFSMNLYKIYKLYTDQWVHDTEYIFHWLSALGYLNSSLNFFIYSAINKKFRTTFWRLLGMKRSHKRKSWMLPPPKAPKTRRKSGCESERNASLQEQSERFVQRENGGQALSLAVSIEGIHQTVLNNGRNSPLASGKRKSENFLSVKGSRRHKKRGSGLVSLIPLTRHLSIRKPQIVIEDVANSSDKKKSSLSISAGGETTYRRSSDDCIQRSSSEVFGGGIIFPTGTHHNSRRGSAMSNSSASLQLHDIHQIEAQSAEEMAEVEVKAAEIFV